MGETGHQQKHELKQGVTRRVVSPWNFLKVIGAMLAFPTIHGKAAGAVFFFFTKLLKEAGRFRASQVAGVGVMLVVP